MEIMVVIIVIAVLASVSGPMIAGIVDQGKVTATKAAMQAVKTGLIRYSNDLGKFPFCGTNASLGSAYNTAGVSALGTTIDTNCLVTNSSGLLNLNMPNWLYQKRWSGPYMDTDPAEFMIDPWESKILYQHGNKGIWLHSYGPDGMDDFVQAIMNNYEGDDIVISLSKVKF